MKIAITAKGPDVTSAVDPRFGRAPFILIVDTETKAVEAIDNSVNANAFKGAGIQAATLIADRGVQVLMTGYCGPNAFRTLEASGIKVINDISETVEEAVNTFLAGDVVYSEDANVEGHW